MGTTRAVAVAVVGLILGGCTGDADHRRVEDASPQSSQVATTIVPQLRGTVTESNSDLCTAGLVGRIVSAPHIENGGPGLNGLGVISSSPGAGSVVPRGSEVLLTLGPDVNAGGGVPPPPGSSLPNPSPVPNVIGLDVDDAMTALRDSFAVDITVVTPAYGLVVTEQKPSAGAHLTRGGTVRITAGSYPGGPCP